MACRVQTNMPEKKTTDLKPRKCRFCTSKFTPVRMQDKDSGFCTDECRISFHKGGTKEYQRLMKALVVELTRSIHETAFEKIRRQRMEELRAEIDESVDASIKRYYSPERIEQMLLADADSPVMAAINKVARAAAENAFKALVQDSAEPKQELSNHGS